MRRFFVPSLLVLTVSVVLSGCGPDESGGTYEDVEALRDAFVAAGGECDDWEQTNRVLGAAQSGDCGTDTVLSTYLTHDAVQDRIAETKASAFGAITGDWLTGENWIINGGDIEALQSKLGGTIVSFAGDDESSGE